MYLRTFIGAAALALAGTFAAQAQAASTIRVAESPELGAYLVDQNGMSLYMFEEDRRDGERGRSVESDCVADDCLSRWPQLGGDPLPLAGDGIDASLIGAFVRPDGKSQAMYNGWPLYTFAEDFVEGDVNGHGFEEFGGEWYLLTPAGGDVGNRNHEHGDSREDDHGGHGADD